MTKKHYNIPAVRIEIKPSNMIKGEVGVFATRNLKKDSIVADADQFTEKFISWDEFKSLDSITQEKVMAYCCGDSKGFYAPPDLNYISIAWHMNHCCSPNVGFDSKFNFVAMRNVKKGEELCWDYSFHESNPDFKMECSCGSKNCRKTITGNDWKVLVTVKKNLEYLSKDIKKLAKLS